MIRGDRLLRDVMDGRMVGRNGGQWWYMQNAVKRGMLCKLCEANILTYFTPASLVRFIRLPVSLASWCQVAHPSDIPSHLEVTVCTGSMLNENSME